MNKLLKIMIVVIIVFGVISLICYNSNDNKSKLTIISTSFPGYDFARAVVKDGKDVEVKMLLAPGAESHDFEPTPQDIKNINNSDMFIYVGGDSDEWVDNLLTNIDVNKTKVIKLMDLVNVVEEELVPGMEEHDHDHEHEGHEEHEEHEHEEEVEYDEHVWTSPVNAITIINKLKDEIIKIDNENKSLYEENTSNYVSELTNIDTEIRNIVKNSKRKEIIFGDRFPLRYFVDEYKLSYYAAFPGCSEQTEASAKTISFLIDKVRKDKVPYVFHIELSNGKIAEQIAKETGTKVLEFKTAHNIPQKDFDAGVTYVDIMKDNIKVLKEALN